MNGKKTNKIFSYAAGSIAIASALLIVWPAPSLSVPTIPDPPQLTGNSSIPGLENRLHQNFFDLHALPPVERPQSKPAAVDPGAVIKKYQLLGVTINENDAIALLSNGVQQIALKRGDKLKGFTVSNVAPRKVAFVKGDVSVFLQLPEATARNGDKP